MEFEEVKDSAKEWFNNRLKNPYFTSVLAVWLITNRVVVFGLFNFSEDQNLEERVSWVHHQLQNKTVLIFSGFEGIILYSFLMGFIAMIVFNYLNIFGKIVYSVIGRGGVSLLRKLEPSKWVPFKDLEELKKENDRVELLLEEKKDEIASLRNEKDVALNNITDLKNQIEKLHKEGIENIGSRKELEELTKENQELEKKYKNLLDSKEDYIITNKLEHDFEVAAFLESEDAHYFGAIFAGVQEQKPITSVPNSILDSYMKRGLLSVEKNLFIMTPKGKMFYLAYLNKK